MFAQKNTEPVGFIVYDARFKNALPRTFPTREAAVAHIGRVLDNGANADSDFRVVEVPLNERWRQVSD